MQLLSANLDTWRFTDTDFSKVAESIGCFGIRVERPGDIQSALEQAFESGRPAVVDVVTDQLNQSQDGIYICGAMKIDLGAQGSSCSCVWRAIRCRRLTSSIRVFHLGVSLDSLAPVPWAP